MFIYIINAMIIMTLKISAFIEDCSTSKLAIIGDFVN